MICKIQTTVLYNPRVWLIMSFAFIAIATTRCGDAYR